MTQNITAPKKMRPIGLMVACISLVICLLVGGFVSWQKVSQLTRILERQDLKNIEELTEAASGPAGIAVWHLDVRAMVSMANSFTKDPAVQSFSTFDETGERFVHSEAAPYVVGELSPYNRMIRFFVTLIAKVEPLEITRQLTYRQGPEERVVGTMVLTSSPEHLISKVSQIVGHLVESLLLISASLFVVVSLVVHHIVTKPLSAMGALVEALDPGKPDLSRPIRTSRINRGDEIDLIGWKINQFVRRSLEQNKIIRESEDRFHRLLEGSLQGFLVVDQAHDIVYANTASARIFGYETPEELIRDFSYADSFFDPGIMDPIDTLPDDGHLNFQAEKRRGKDGEAIYIDSIVNKVFWENRPHKQVVLVNVTERVAAEKELRALATRDSVTELPNRALFREHLNNQIKISGDETIAVLYLDIRSLISMNDLYGRGGGDEILFQAGKKIEERLPNDSILAHLGAGRFAILLTPFRSIAQLSHLRQEILANLKFRLEAAGNQDGMEEQLREVTLDASFSACLSGKDGKDADELLERCEQLCHFAKRDKVLSVQMSDPKLERKLSENAKMESLISLGLDNREFYLMYQPKIHAMSGEVSGCEALVRWQNADRQIYPDEFIPIAEESGQIVMLGNQILDLAAQQIVQWQERSGLKTKVAVNVSAIQLVSGNVFEEYCDVLERYKLKPEQIQIEITESATMQQMELVSPVLARLREMGVSIAIDDFGTGYSSLSYLKQLPITHLKLDRSFVVDLPERDAIEIAKAISGLGHALDLTIIAEGVETLEQANYLRSFSYDQFQGYFFSKPLLPDDFRDFTEKQPEENHHASQSD